MADTHVPLFSLVYTSVRPKIIPQVVELWNSRSKHHDIEWCISVDEGDTVSLESAQLQKVINPLYERTTVKVTTNKGPKNCNAGWNAAAEISTGKIIIAVADDFMPLQNWDEALLALEPKTWPDEDRVIHINDGYVRDLCTLAILTRTRYEKFGYLWYPKYQCLPGRSLVYMADQTFKPISQVKAGDIVIGSKNEIGPFSKAGQKRSTLTPSKVLRKLSYAAPTVSVKMESGHWLECTADHMWAYYGDGRLAYMPKRQHKNGPVLLKNGFLYGHPRVGRKLVHVVDPPADPPAGLDWLRGWLAGFFDGEGCFPCFAQSEKANPETCAHLRYALKKLNFSFTEKSLWSHNKPQKVFTVTGGRQEYLRFFNWIHPVRWFKKQGLKRMMTARFGNPDRIVLVDPMSDNEEVFCLETETENYIADGYLSHNSMFNDTEFTEVAYRDGVVIEAMHLLFEHIHPDCGKRERDDVDRAHASQERWNTGEMLFKFRKARGFPLDDGPKAPVYTSETETKPETKKNDEFVAYMQVTQDDLCLLEVCKRLAEEGVKIFFFAQPNEYWSGETIDYVYKDEVDKIAEQVRALGLIVHQKTFDVKKYRFTGDDRLTVETRVRNDSLAWVRSLGYHNILIVDGDELWMRGTLEMLKPYIEQGHTAISTYMIPVIGLPGYPIEMAQDLAVVYIGGTIIFKSCRTPTIRQTVIPFPRIYHFTGMRRTMEETIKKHRRSGHYDDPDYDFEGWLKDILPNIKPGYEPVWPDGRKGWHMYKKYQIWNTLRHWRADELAALPESIKPYLGGLPDIFDDHVQRLVAP